VTEGTVHPGRVGPFDLAVVCAEPSAEAAERWAGRAERLADWLLSEWDRERKEDGRERFP
jgi:hypothetical protein